MYRSSRVTIVVTVGNGTEQHVTSVAVCDRYVLCV